MLQRVNPSSPTIQHVPLAKLVLDVTTRNPGTKPNETFTYVDLSAVDQAQKAITGARVLVGSEAPSRARQVICADDVLVSTVRPNLNGVALVPEDYDGAIASTGFCVLRPNRKHLDPVFLFHWVQSPAFVAEMVRKATGASYPAVSDRIVQQSLIPLPPLCEQRRIAAILDQADALRATRREALAKLDEMAQAIFVEMFGDPILNQKSWPKVCLKDALARIESGWSPTCLDRPVQNGEWGVLKLSAVTQCVFDPAQNKALPAGVSPRQELEVKPGDLLFTRKNTRELVAACALVKSTSQRLMIPDLIFRLRLKNTAPLNALFFHSLLVHPSQRSAVQSLAGGSAGSMPNISKAKLFELEVIAPPSELQDIFAKRIDSLDFEKKMMGEATSFSDMLFSSLQHHAFSGTL
jgi:type I restriction enzyme S subunit